MLCNLYIVALTLLLPLYTRGTYMMLGDDKYGLFLSVSLLCLGLWSVVALAEAVVRWFRRLRAIRGHGPAEQKPSEVSLGLCASLPGTYFSVMDICVLLYGLSAVVSALCSNYDVTAWTGYQDWHMGAISQLLFVGIYFFASRTYQGNSWPIYLWETAFFVVTFLGFSSRFGCDPLGLMNGFNSGDWEYSHLISTLGNINWFCGYCSVALAMPVAGYLRGNAPIKRGLLYLVSVLGLLLLCVQGSDAGPVLAAVCLIVCLLWSMYNMEYFRRTLLLASGVSFGLPCYSILVGLLGERALKAQPADGPGMNVFGWGGWWLAGVVFAGLSILLGRFLDLNISKRTCISGADETQSRDGSALCRKIGGSAPRAIDKKAAVKGLWLGMVLVAAILAISGGVWYLSRLVDSEGWISGRGALWRLSWQGFLRGNWKQKLLGAGPDCFAEYIYSVFAPSELPVVEGHWAQAVFANAHNHWLNHLVNVGLLGLVCAIGIFVLSLMQYRRYLPGVLALAMYGINSLVSFQQVLSTPLFFLMLGLCEYTLRRDRQKKEESAFVDDIVEKDNNLVQGEKGL